MLKLLRPSYQPPSAKVIGTSLLDKVYNEICEEVKIKSKNKFVTIMQDGWSANHEAPVISHSLSIEGSETAFPNAIAATNNVKDAAYCGKLAEDAIYEAESKFECTVGALITDNCATMLKMRSDLAGKYPDLLTYGCNTHYLNLVGKEAIDEEDEEKVRKVQSYFRENTYARETLRMNKKGLMAQLPVATRWNSKIASFKNFLHNHSVYGDIAKGSESSFPPHIIEILTDFNFYRKIQIITASLKPLEDAIRKLQHEKATVSLAVHQWMKVLKSCDESVTSTVKFKRRMRSALSPFVCAAYILDPYYRGELLTPEFLELGQNWLAQKSPLYFNASVKLAVNDDVYFPKNMMDKSILRGEHAISGAQWWDMVGTLMAEKFPIGLAKLASQLMKLPASTSGMERCFSTLGSIMTDKRNRIGIEKAGRLCMIYRTLNSEKLLNSDDYLADDF